MSDKLFPVIENDDGIRNAGPKDECFYCKRKIGEMHRADCVTIKKRVRVVYSFTLDIEVPAHWTKAQIESHRNESSWCADNALDELSKASHSDAHPHCLCDDFTCECLNPEGEPFVEPPTPPTELDAILRRMAGTDGASQN